jgi:hypothetical protein
MKPQRWCTKVLPVCLRKTTIYRHGGEVLLNKKTVELLTSSHTIHKDNHLIELQSIQQVVELAVLLGFCELDIVLLKTVKGQLALIRRIALDRIGGELLAHRADFLAQGGREEHDLLFMGSGTEDSLDITSHT